MMDVYLMLRGVECCVSGISMSPADPDVGIMSAYPDGYTVIDDQNRDITDSLTQEEEDKICEKICEVYADSQSDEYPDD